MTERGRLPAELRCRWTMDLDVLHTVCVYVGLGAVGLGAQKTALSQLHVCEIVCGRKPGRFMAAYWNVSVCVCLGVGGSVPLCVCAYVCVCLPTCCGSEVWCS